MARGGDADIAACVADRGGRARREHRAHARVERRDAQLLRQGATRDRLAHCDRHERVRELHALGTYIFVPLTVYPFAIHAYSLSKRSCC